jgi:hypothetical protein
VLAALLAIFLQAFAVQTHVHAYASAGASAYGEVADSQAIVASDEHSTAAAHQPLCAFCQTLANSGRAAIPESTALSAYAGAAYETAALDIRRAPRALTHSWQSRAPPVVL